MKNITLKTAVSIAALSLTCSTSLFAGSYINSANEGTVNITVVDENGKPVQDAPVYIYGEHKTHFVGGKDIPGTTTFSMKEGAYRISSAIVRKTGDYIDRFATNEAHVQVTAGDNVCVILTLKPLQSNEDQISYAQLHVSGLPAGLINN